MANLHKKNIYNFEKQNIYLSLSPLETKIKR